MSCCPKNSESQMDSVVHNYKYSPLKDLTKYNCSPSCICRWNKERSHWDKLQFAWLEKGKKLHIPPASQHFIRSWNGDYKY